MTKKAWWKKWWVIAIAALLVLFVLAGIFGGGDDGTDSADSPTTDTTEVTATVLPAPTGGTSTTDAYSAVGALVAGAVLGIAASFLAWLAVVTWMRPKIHLYPEIRTRSQGDGSETYRVKYWNARGGSRSACDIEIKFYLWLADYFLPDSETHRIAPVIASGASPPGLLPRSDRIAVLDVDSAVAELDLPGDVRDSMTALGALKGILVTRELSEGGDTRCRKVELRCWVTYTDSYSGVRRADHYRWNADDVITDGSRFAKARPTAPKSIHAT